MTEYLDILNAYKRDMLDTLAGVVAFNSVKQSPTKGAHGEIHPYGDETAECLRFALAKGEELGFESLNLDNYAGHIEWKADDSDEYVYIVGHLDVVPAGDVGWDSDPFNMTEREGFVYGRGVSDDKGPVIAALYALKALKDSGFKPSRNIRLVLATDEETGTESIRYYTDRMGQPIAGFTPDSEFPLNNGEMGILTFELAQRIKPTGRKEGLRLTKLEAGTAANAVPSYAKAVVASADSSAYDVVRGKAAEFCDETGYNVKTKRSGSSLIIEVYGRAAHGAHPQLGLNAVSIIMSLLGRLEFNSEEINDFIDFYNEKIAFCNDGSLLGCYAEDEESGRLIFNVGIAAMNEEYASITVNIRYPVTFDSDYVYSAIENALAGKRIGIIKKHEAKPIYMDTDSYIVSKLITAYRDETGDIDAEPIVIAGGTYAKEVDNILAFGGLFPNEEDTMHQANERMSIESYIKMARIYARAIKALAEKETDR